LSSFDQATGTFAYEPAPGYTGTDTFAFRAFDGTVDSDLATVSITVTDEPLALMLLATPTSGLGDLAVTFEALADGGTGTYTYAWDFGDGATSTLAAPSHTYGWGVHGATITVSDGVDLATDSVVITVGGVRGDFNGDGTVDLDDFVLMKQNFGRTDATWATGDVDGDGGVTLDDFVVLKQNFGALADPASAVDGPGVDLLAADVESLPPQALHRRRGRRRRRDDAGNVLDLLGQEQLH